MNEIIKAMVTRRSCRKFKADMPAKEDIQAVIEAGLYAANGMGKQATKIIAVTNKELRDQLSKDNASVMGRDMDPFYGGPVVLVVLADKSVPTSKFDGALVMGNMLLAAHSLGLGSIWVHRAKEEFEMEKNKELLKKLGIEGEWEGVGHCVLGYADGELGEGAPRKDDRVFWCE